MAWEQLPDKDGMFTGALLYLPLMHTLEISFGLWVDSELTLFSCLNTQRLEITVGPRIPELIPLPCL